MANVITTLLKLDSNQFKTGMKAAQQSISETDGVVSKAKAGWAGMWDSFKSSPIAVGAATTAVTAFAAQSIAAASDLNESINAVNVTFGESADKILAFGDNAAKSVGLAKSEFNELATPLGSILKNAGFQLDDVADKTIILTQRAADMASVFNTDVSDALGAIQAGLRGEQDPLERYGVGLSAAKVEARALADTGKENVKQLTDQEKALARVETILDQTNQTAGDFANTSDGLANQTRTLNAQLKDLEAVAGENLIPALSDLAAIIGFVAENTEKMNSELSDEKGGGALADFVHAQLTPFGNLKLASDALHAAVDKLSDSWGGATESSDRFNDSVLAGGDTAQSAAAAVTDLGDATATAAEEVADLGDKASNAGPKIGDMAGALDDAQQKLADLNDEARDNALNALAEAAKAVGDAVETAFDKVRDNLDLQDLVDNITDQFGEVADAEKEATDPEGIRNYNRTVRDLQRQLLTLLDSIKGIPPDKRIQIAAQIQSGDIDQLYRILGDLTKGVTVPVSFATPSTPAFTSANAVFTPGQAPSAPTFSQSAIPSTTINNVTINNPIGSTPTTQYIDGQTDFRRNGLR